VDANPKWRHSLQQLWQGTRASKERAKALQHEYSSFRASSPDGLASLALGSSPTSPGESPSGPFNQTTVTKEERELGGSKAAARSRVHHAQQEAGLKERPASPAHSRDLRELKSHAIVERCRGPSRYPGGIAGEQREQIPRADAAAPGKGYPARGRSPAKSVAFVLTSPRAAPPLQTRARPPHGPETTPHFDKRPPGGDLAGEAWLPPDLAAQSALTGAGAGVASPAAGTPAVGGPSRAGPFAPGVSAANGGTWDNMGSDGAGNTGGLRDLYQRSGFHGWGLGGVAFVNGAYLSGTGGGGGHEPLQQSCGRQQQRRLEQEGTPAGFSAARSEPPLTTPEILNHIPAAGLEGVFAHGISPGIPSYPEVMRRSWEQPSHGDYAGVALSGASSAGAEVSPSATSESMILLPPPPQQQHKSPDPRTMETVLEVLPASPTGGGRPQTALSAEPLRGQPPPPQSAQDERLEPRAPADPPRHQPSDVSSARPTAANYTSNAAAQSASRAAAADMRRATSPAQPVQAATPPSGRLADDQEVTEDGEPPPQARGRHSCLRALPNVEYCGSLDALLAAADSWILHGGADLEGGGVPGAGRGHVGGPRLPAPITPLPAPRDRPTICTEMRLED